MVRAKLKNDEPDTGIDKVEEALKTYDPEIDEVAEAMRFRGLFDAPIPDRLCGTTRYVLRCVREDIDDVVLRLWALYLALGERSFEDEADTVRVLVADVGAKAEQLRDALTGRIIEEYAHSTHEATSARTGGARRCRDASAAPPPPSRKRRAG